jgi:hypothetical protein
LLQHQNFKNYILFENQNMPHALENRSVLGILHLLCRPIFLLTCCLSESSTGLAEIPLLENHFPTKYIFLMKFNIA